MVISVNGKIVDEKKTCLPVTSEAFLFGYAVFETIRTYNKKVFRLDDHLGRLYVSADVIGLKPKWSFKQTYKAVVEILKESKNKEEKIRVILTKDDLLIMMEKLQEKPKSFYEKGVKLVSYIGRRNMPRAKVLADCFLYVARKYAVSCGAFDAVLVDPKKYYVRECSYANIFWVDGGEIFTTNKNILFGITRDTVAEMTNCRFDGIKLKSLLNADEVFITQTTSGILPVVEIDGQKIGNGKPGAVTKKVMKDFKKLVWAEK